MSEVYVGAKRYEALSSDALYENEYEHILAAEAKHLFPEFHMLPFKEAVTSDAGTKKADYALIDQAYRRWWVIEVELVHHSLEGHVMPQVDVLVNGDYGVRHADYLAGKSPQLNRRALREMMRGEPPSVIVIVNEHSDDWKRVLGVLGAQMTVVRIFRSDAMKHVLLTEGYRPEVVDDVVSRCRRSDVLPRWFQVEAPAALPVAPEEVMTIFIGDRATFWRRVDSADKVWLAPRGSVSLEAATVDLVQVDNARFAFRSGT